MSTSPTHDEAYTKSEQQVDEFIAKLSQLQQVPLDRPDREGLKNHVDWLFGDLSLGQLAMARDRIELGALPGPLLGPPLEDAVHDLDLTDRDIECLRQITVNLTRFCQSDQGRSGFRIDIFKYEALLDQAKRLRLKIQIYLFSLDPKQPYVETPPAN